MDRRRIFPSLLLLNLSLPLDGLANLPLQLIMKDHLGAGPLVIATSNAVIGAPVLVAWLAGFLRDWKSGGSIDRFFVVGGMMSCACCYAFLAANVTSVQVVAVLAFLASAALLLAKTSLQAVMSHAAQQTRTEDRAGALWNIVDVLPTLFSYALGAWLLSSLGASGFFFLCSCIAFTGSLLGIGAVASLVPSPTNPQPSITSRLLRELLVDWKFLSAVLVIFLFTFSPGWQTPILFYLTDAVGLSQTDFGRFWLFNSLGVVAGCGIYARWAQSAPENTMLTAATLLMVLQSPLPLFIHNAASAYLIGAVSGGLYGFAIAAYWSGLIRSIPPGLHGASYMIAVLVSAIGVRGGDIVGSWMLGHYGYVLPFVVTTIATALIGPVLLFRGLMTVRTH